MDAASFFYGDKDKMTVMINLEVAVVVSEGCGQTFSCGWKAWVAGFQLVSTDALAGFCVLYINGSWDVMGMLTCFAKLAGHAYWVRHVCDRLGQNLDGSFCSAI
jgi:hypothetical protein